MTLIVRPDGWDLPLFVHVAGAMLLVGALVLAGAALAGGLRAAGTVQAQTLTRFGFRTLLLAAIPAFVAMRVGAEWIAAEEDVGEPAWIGVGYITSDGGLLLLIVATVVAGLAQRRMGRGAAATKLTRVAAALSVVMILVFLVAVWAMTTKPL